LPFKNTKVKVTIATLVQGVDEPLCEQLSWLLLSS